MMLFVAFLCKKGVNMKKNYVWKNEVFNEIFSLPLYEEENEKVQNLISGYKSADKADKKYLAAKTAKEIAPIIAGYLCSVYSVSGVVEHPKEMEKEIRKICAGFRREDYLLGRAVMFCFSPAPIMEQDWQGCHYLQFWYSQPKTADVCRQL